MTDATAYAPGRAELLGNHTDYNEGYVLSIAINTGTTIKASPRKDRKLHLNADDLQMHFSGDLDSLKPQENSSWANYLLGVLDQLQQRKIDLNGADLNITTTIPIGAGLSSSAALEVATALVFQKLYPFELDGLEMARVAQAAEHEYAGVRCGLLDQISVLLSKAGHATFIDCRSYDVSTHPIPDNAKFVIVHSGVKHALVSGAYNERREACEEAARLLEKPALRDVSTSELEAARDRLPDLTYRRARHVVEENERVQSALSALQAADLNQFGKLMFESHESSRKNFENSCFELDSLVGYAREIDGCYGARLSGGGFGGATINLVDLQAVDSFCQTIAERYQADFDLETKILVTEPSDGAR